MSRFARKRKNSSPFTPRMTGKLFFYARRGIEPAVTAREADDVS